MERKTTTDVRTSIRFSTITEEPPAALPVVWEPPTVESQRSRRFGTEIISTVAVAAISTPLILFPVLHTGGEAVVEVAQDGPQIMVQVKTMPQADLDSLPSNVPKFGLSRDRHIVTMSTSADLMLPRNLLGRTGSR